MVRRKSVEQTDDYLAGPIHSLEDLRGFRVPDPEDDAGFANLREVLKRFKETRIVCFASKATFNFVWYLMGGMEEYLVKMYTEPDLILAINTMVSEFHLAQARKAISLGADVISLADDYAFRQNAFIPREKFIEFCLPAIRRMADLVHSLGGRLLFHSDGKLDEFLDLIVDAGIDFLHPVEPLAMDIGEVYGKYRDRVVICGNVDCAHTLTFGTPADARREVLRLLADIAPGGRYIMTSSNTIHSRVRADTYRAMLDTLREYGRYPIPSDRFAAGG
jgi:uroporphyrinogen decarboxylase